MTRRARYGLIGGGGAIGLSAALIAALSTIGGSGDTISPNLAGGSGSGAVVLDLQALRDFGALAPRGTGAGEWCGPLTRGGTDYPAHCWPLQQSIGDATDYGSPGGWHLSPVGSPRAGVATGLPVGGGAAVDWTSEAAVWLDQGAGVYYVDTSITSAATGLVSVSMVFNSTRGANLSGLFAASLGTQYWYAFLNGTNGKFALSARGDNSVVRTVNGTNAWDDGAWHCATLVFSQASGGTKIFVDGAEEATSGDLDTGGTWAGSGYFRLGVTFNTSNTLSGAEARARIGLDVAVTLAQHRALCGSWGLSLKASHRAANDTTWTQSGGARCYPASATTATCYPGGAPAATWDEDRVGSPVTNRIASNTGQQLDCAGAAWTCVGVASTVPGQTDPMGGSTATTVTVAGGANHFEQDAIAGYTADASPLNLTIWAKCSTGVFHPHGSNDGTRGDWDVDCTCIGGAWRKLTASDACVTVNVPFNASATGTSGFHIDGTGFPASLDVWAPTLTEEANTTAMPTGSEPRTIGAGLAGPWTWATDAPGAVNRVLYSTAIDSTNWTVRGTATAVPAVAPDGSNTAAAISVGAFGVDDIFKQAAGFSNAAVLYTGVWVKCSSGTLRMQNPGGGGGATGNWYIDCSVINGEWALVSESSQPMVAEIQPWTASAVGAGGYWFAAVSGTVTATLWVPTQTEEPTTGAVVPTAAAAVSTGTIAWIVDNASSRYGVATSTYTSVLDTIDGTCLETGSTIRLSGGSGTECVGAWESLQVRR